MSKLIRDSDEHWRDNLVGLMLDARLQSAISQRHHQEILIERTEARITKLRNNPKVAIRYNVAESTFCAIIGKEKKILDIDFNQPNDLLLDNFGYWLAGLLHGTNAQANSINLVNDGNTSRTLGFYGVNGSFFNYNTSCGTAFRCGSSTTAAIRADYKIGTALGTAPESSYFPAGYGSYATGQGLINSSNVLTAGGSGTINEIGLFGYWYGSNGLEYFMLFHDILASGISYVTGNGIIVAYGLTF